MARLPDVATPLDIRHFRTPPPPAPAPLNGAARLAARLGEACVAGLSAIRGAAWRVTAEAIAEACELPPEHEGALFRFESGRGSLTCLLLLDRPAISALLEVAMGGVGTESAHALDDRPLSRIERGVLQLAREALAEQLTQGLSDATATRFSLFGGRDAPELDPAGGLVQFRYVLNIFSYGGEISIAFSRPELERQLNGIAPDAEHPVELAGRGALQQEMGKSEVVLTAALAPETLAVEAIAGLRPGLHLALSATATAPVTLWSGGVAAYLARLGRSGDRFAVTITAAL